MNENKLRGGGVAINIWPAERRSSDDDAKDLLCSFPLKWTMSCTGQSKSRRSKGGALIMHL
jgi:hypothetical protein